MPNRSDLASVHLDVNLGHATAPAKPDPEDPFRLLVAGQFGGRQSRKPILVDRDNLDDVLAQAGPELRLDSPPVHLKFRSLDDFHPDQLYRQVSLFRALEQATPHRATDDLATLAQTRPMSMPDVTAMTGSLLDEMIEGTAAAPARARPADPLRDYIDRAVAPHLQRGKTASEKEREAAQQHAAAEVMRAILHHPSFQALEAAWRGLDFLVRRLETDSLLQVYLLDLPKPELAGFAAAGDWAAIVGLYTFGESAGDLELLSTVVERAARLGAPFLAEAHPSLLSDSPREWQTLRRSATATYVGLAAPRFLLRLPYGEEGDSVESFPFEEMPEGEPSHQHYLWGNPALVCALLLGQAFSTDGWEMRPGRPSEVRGLPLHIYQAAGESAAKPCAEILMTEEALEQILDAGVMAMASPKEQDRIIVPRFQSVAEPLRAMAGKWKG